MGLNIKAADVEAMATELARLKGTTKTGAIRQALERELETATHEARTQERLNRINAIASDFRRRMDELGIDPKALDHNDLYGEDGLPS